MMKAKRTQLQKHAPIHLVALCEGMYLKTTCCSCAQYGRSLNWLQSTDTVMHVRIRVTTQNPKQAQKGT